MIGLVEDKGMLTNQFPFHPNTLTFGPSLSIYKQNRTTMSSETLSKLTTYDDYRNLPDDGNQYQIIGGDLHMTPAPSVSHQRISKKIFKIIDDYVTANKRGEVLFAPVDVILSMTDVVQPDILFVAGERLNIITEKNIVEAPDLIVEILSEHTESIDRNRKKELYERFGVQEYWLVDPANRQIDQFVLRNKAFVLKASAGADQTISSAILDGCNIPLNQIFPTT
jgi:Uma2 family endonuclease